MAGRAGRRLIPDPAGYSGRLWRILFSDRQHEALDPARHPEGRFHHDGQRALYASPTPDAAGVAIDSYYRPGDPPRIILPLWLDGARLLDFRDPATSAALGLCGDETTVDWRTDRAAGHPARSWRASDAARAAGADGIIYFSRKARPLWHVALFCWNGPSGPELHLDGEARPFE